MWRFSDNGCTFSTLLAETVRPANGVRRWRCWTIHKEELFKSVGQAVAAICLLSWPVATASPITQGPRCLPLSLCSSEWAISCFTSEPWNCKWSVIVAVAAGLREKFLLVGFAFWFGYYLPLARSDLVSFFIISFVRSRSPLQTRVCVGMIITDTVDQAKSILAKLEWKR